MDPAMAYFASVYTLARSWHTRMKSAHLAMDPATLTPSTLSKLAHVHEVSTSGYGSSHADPVYTVSKLAHTHELEVSSRLSSSHADPVYTLEVGTHA